jgi:hypothetical protein
VRIIEPLVIPNGPPDLPGRLPWQRQCFGGCGRSHHGRRILSTRQFFRIGRTLTTHLAVAFFGSELVSLKQMPAVLTRSLFVTGRNLPAKFTVLRAGPNHPYNTLQQAAEDGACGGQKH